jgi:antibiotic biosynthesis monooxygenase (ABM) superfamily enzyme
MIQAITLIPAPLDPEADETVLDMLKSSLKKTPGVLSIQVNSGHIMSPQGPPPYSKVIKFSFDSLENMMAWTQSPEAQSQKEAMSKINPVMIYFEVEDLLV